MAMGAMILWRAVPAGEHSENHPAPATAIAPLRADNVQFDRELVSAFDAVAQMPDGEPVRLRCREWMDRMVLSDRERGLVVEQRVPHVEVVPVRFETY
jgi:hypothetical protein